MRGDVLGAVERRRRWTDAEKFAVVCEVGHHGASVTQVAQRHDLRRQQIYAWRHDLRKKGLCAPEGAALFLPVELAPPQVTEAKVAADIASPMVEIVLRNGRQIRCRGGIGDDDLARLIPLTVCIEPTIAGLHAISEVCARVKPFWSLSFLPGPPGMVPPRPRLYAGGRSAAFR